MRESMQSEWRSSPSEYLEESKEVGHSAGGKREANA